MRKVLIIIGKLYIGGAERIGRDIGYYADKTKYEIHYLVFNDDIGVYEEELKNVGCIIHHMPPPSEGYFQYYRNLVHLIRSEQIDVIHSHTMFSSGWAILAGKMCGVPIRIVHSHTIRGPEKRNLIKKVYENIMRWIIIHTATDLVACGKGAGDWFYGAKIFQKRGKLIYNGIELKEFVYDEEKRKKIRTQYGVQKKVVIGHVGHLAAVKNQRFLLEIMPDILSVCPDAVLFLLGDGNDFTMLQSIIKKKHLDDCVILTGNVSNVGEFMSAMDVFVFPSLYEGLPLALVEAQTNGLPCLISDRIPTDIYLTDLVKVISLDDSSQQWVRAITEAKRKDPMAYGQIMYQLGFDTSDMLERIYQLYGNVHFYNRR